MGKLKEKTMRHKTILPKAAQSMMTAIELMQIQKTDEPELIY